MTMSTRIEAAGGPRRAGLRGWIDRLVGDRRGVAAVEFALIVPLLLCMYLVTMETSQGIETNKKLSRVASMVADLIAQQQSVTAADVTAVMQIGAALLQPYNRSKPTITVTAIEITDEATPKVLVFWSRHLDDKGVASKGSLTKGNTVTVPAALKVRNSFLVRVESTLNYKPVITYSTGEAKTLGLTTAFNNISMGETYYLRPRMSTQVTCGDC
jgi:Flp pilus assembly protein TadG